MRFFVLLLLPVVGLLARPCAAQDTTTGPSRVEQAQQHYAQGEALFEAENFEGALAELQRAYELLEGDPAQVGILYNIGQCYERLFRYDRALDAYRRYLEAAPDAEDAGEVRGIMRSLEGLLATIQITTNVEHAEVWIDDRLVGEAPGDVLVPGGRHTIELRAPGYLPGRREVQVAARATIEQEVPLEAVPEQTGLDPIWFWMSSGVAVALAGVGAGFGIYAMDLHDQSGGYDIDDWQARVDEAALEADVFFGAAALFAATAVVFAIFTQWSDPPETPAVAIVPTPGGAALTAAGAF